MPIYLVPDPTYAGKGDGPNMVRSDAMRKLFKAGMSVGDVARKYDVSYARAYRAIDPPRKNAAHPHSTAAKPLTEKRLQELSKSRLEKIYHQKRRRGPDNKPIEFTPEENVRIEAAGRELERRGVRTD